ncbi:NAD-dependent protein deacylase [Bacillus sp. V3B]|uniref:NAD-dependent protein deacylase n=1 Tax=Bacillus sp. V3B TaxID=2804915 RepID=UPI002108C62F|nr:NAD-dependent protein deacylase [Bacillus sp. V3B]MCQ6276569.1 NAD-dependent protein deacylase [Bacillus sp. V3B]
MENNMIETCTDFIKKAKSIVVLTGAGISTESGIKDFRSSTGIYQKAPEYILSLDYFYEHPKEFYQFAIENLYHPDAVPNIGHEILATWEKEGKVTHIITQNIDGLHQKAGSENVIEFHGTMKTASCMNCGKIYSTEEMVNRLNQMVDYYICNHCDSQFKQDRYIRPDVVLFGDAGEWFTLEGFQTINHMINQADCLLVLGTSLKVTPFSTFPQNRGEEAPMVLINKGDSPYDHSYGTYVIHDSIGKTLAQINENLR